MKPLENELRNLLRRREPPEGFAERVMVKLGAPPPPQTLVRRISAIFRSPLLRWVAVAAACVVVVLAVVRYEHQQRARVQAEQAIQALEMARNELNTALEQAQHMTIQIISAPKETGARKE